MIMVSGPVHFERLGLDPKNAMETSKLGYGIGNLSAAMEHAL